LCNIARYTEIYTSKITESELYRETLSPKFQSAKEMTAEQIEILLEKVKELLKEAAAKSKEYAALGFEKSKVFYSEKVVPYWNETVVPTASEKWEHVKEYSREKAVPAVKEYGKNKSKC
jgi:hypothetical protein